MTRKEDREEARKIPKERFKWGDMLKSTKRYEETGIYNNPRTQAVYLGVSKNDPDCVIVVREGLKTAESFHKDFWEAS